MGDTQTAIFWQTGKPLKTGEYIVTIYYKSLNIYSVKTDYYHEQDGWTYYNDGSVVAWCDLKYIKPYTSEQIK
jgi:hypothetical protein